MSSIEISIGLRKDPMGVHGLRRQGTRRRGRNFCPGEGRLRLGSRQLNVRICRCARFLVVLRRAPNRRHLRPALLIRRHERLLFHRLLAPILPRRFLPFRPFPFPARLLRPFGARFGRLALVSLPRPFPTHISVPICAICGISVDVS